MSDEEVTIQIVMEADEDVLSAIARGARKATKEALARGAGLAEYVHETQWCAGAMRVTVRRPHLKTEQKETER